MLGLSVEQAVSREKAASIDTPLGQDLAATDRAPRAGGWNSGKAAVSADAGPGWV